MANTSSISNFLFPCHLLFISTLTLFINPTVRCYGQTLFVFGDSLYDPGNKQYLTDKPVPANSPPYGETIGAATGRWSDGLILPDYIAEFFGIPLLQPVLDKKSNLSHGASFAVAGATVLGEPSETMTLGQQVLDFTRMKNNWTDQERASALYMFHIASDDYLSYTKTHLNTSSEEQERFISLVIRGIEEALMRIYMAGGRKFGFQNLPPLGCLPIVKQEHGSGDRCVELPSYMASRHNKNLLQALEKLARYLDGFQFTLFDYFISTDKRIHKPTTYGFVTSNRACCGSGSHDAEGCGIKRDADLCKDPSDYLYFDGRHFTQEANHQMAHLMWAADRDVVGPVMNLRELLLMPMDAPVGPTAGLKQRAGETQSRVCSSYGVVLECGSKSGWLYQLEPASSFFI